MHKKTLFQKITSSPQGIIGLIILIFFIFLALGASFIAPYSPSDMSARPLLAPSSAHWLGTDDVGKDILTVVIYGSRTSLIVAFCVSATVLAIGTIVGVFSGYTGGIVDRAFMRGVDIFLMIPDIPLILIFAAYLTPGIWNIVFILAILGWPVSARITRAQSIMLKSAGHVDFAKVSGGSDLYVIKNHILPDLYPIMATTVVMQSIRAILSESGLAFLGLGDPSYPSWGTIIKYAIGYPSIFFSDAWMWWLLPAGACITLLVLAFVLLGQCLEDDE